jgi:hypothetical protein
MMALERAQSVGPARVLAAPEVALAPLRSAVDAIASRSPRPRPERLSGIHNPWGQAATLTNAWAFLDLCECAPVLDPVAALIGPDLILWDSELHLCAAEYATFVSGGREGRYWPVAPLAGAVALVSLARPAVLHVADVRALSAADLTRLDGGAPLYVIRYMPATSRFARDPQWPANWIAMEEQPLVNYTTRPLWLVRGEDRAGNDFVTGFASNAPRWAVR